MAIRCASKAIIVKEGCILLNRCRNLNGGIYFDLPGGGQHTYETLEDALVREVKEETGYDIKPVRFAALAEEIYTDPFMHERYPEYTHRLLHVFTADIIGEKCEVPFEKDLYMEESVWMPLEKAEKQKINPEGIASRLYDIIEKGETIYLGTRLIAEAE